MSETSELTATPREPEHSASKHLRTKGLVPAVLYGPGIETKSIAVDRHDLERKLSEGVMSRIVQLRLEGTKTPVNTMIREIQTDPVKGRVQHVDFMAVNMSSVVEAVAPIRFMGDSPGVKAGGVFTANLRDLHIEALPADLPEGIDVDCSALEMGDNIHVSGVVAPDGVTIKNDADEIVCSVQAPRAEIEEVEPTVAEPEVIGGAEEPEGE
jgi:large subunit ribosomal protein L25